MPTIEKLLSRTDGNDLAFLEKENARLKSSLVTLLTLAESKNPKLDHTETAEICRRALES